MDKMSNEKINELKQAAQKGEVDDFINKNLSPQATKKLKSILSDKAATDKLLATPEAKELMKKLLGEKNNR
jgi:hypothetical protein